MTAQRASRGRVSHLKGLAAEDAVCRRYNQRGTRTLARRWRGSSGEIDLIHVDEAGCVVFTEVKCARSHARALSALRPPQIRRLIASATEYVAGLPTGQSTFMRFDLAAVDSQGQVEIVENALSA